MPFGFIISLLLHASIVVIALVGLPLIQDDSLVVEPPLVVELVDIAEISNVPAPQPKAPDPAPEKPTPPPQPKPEPPAPKPEIAPEPEPVEPEPAPEPKPEPKPEVKPEPKPEPTPKPRVSAQAPSRKPTPPKPQETFASLMKDLAPTLKKDTPAPQPEEKEVPKPLDDFAQQIQEAIKTPSPNSDPTRKISLSEIDALRQHIAQCWNPPIGAQDAENLKIEIKVTMNPNGTPQAASISSRSNLSDPFYRAAAESALRAVNNQRCWPYPLSAETYNQWKDLTLIFDPKQLLGL